MMLLQAGLLPGQLSGDGEPGCGVTSQEAGGSVSTHHLASADKKLECFCHRTILLRQSNSEQKSLDNHIGSG